MGQAFLLWEGDYARRGKLWGGLTRDLPLPESGSCALELGCGNGKTLSALVQRGWHVIGIDFSVNAIALCRSEVPSSFEGDLVVADACTLPFNDQSFDAVLMIHVLGHVSDPDRRLIANESMRVVKENGKVYFRGFARGDFRCGTGTETEPGTYRRGTGIITHYFCETEIIDLFSPLKKETIKTSQWCMRVRGKELKREEVDAVFTKKCRSCKNSKSFIRVNTNVPL